MLLRVTTVPAGYLAPELESPERKLLTPVGSTPVRLSFQPSKRPAPSTAGPGACPLLKSPRTATPVDPVLNPNTWAPTTGRSIPPPRPSHRPPKRSTRQLEPLS